MRIALKGELTADAGGQAVEDGSVGCAEVSLDEGNLLVGADGVELSLIGSDEVVELGDELLDGGDELDESFGHEDGTEVHAACGTVGHDASDIGDDVVERLVLGLHLLADEGDVGLHLQGALQRDVAGATTHQLDEVPVFAG